MCIADFEGLHPTCHILILAIDRMKSYTASQHPSSAHHQQADAAVCMYCFSNTSLCWHVCTMCWQALECNVDGSEKAGCAAIYEQMQNFAKDSPPGSVLAERTASGSSSEDHQQAVMTRQ